MNKIIKIDLGSGFQASGYKSEYITIDKDPDSMPHILHDIDSGLPLKDNTIDHITMSSVLIYINHKVKLGKEVNRVLKQGGTLHLFTHYLSYYLSGQADIVNIGSFIKASGLKIIKSELMTMHKYTAGDPESGYIEYTLQKL